MFLRDCLWLQFPELHSNFTGGVAFAWTDGTPTAATVGAKTLFFTRGSITMNVPKAGGRRQLTLFLGATNCS